jgi:lipopolysaccharide/colanic/teichoic acid biosynthesis glycosyltransferase
MDLRMPSGPVEDPGENLVHWTTVHVDRSGHLGRIRAGLWGRQMGAIDYLYVANWSLWGDVKILLRTVPHVLGRRGL